MKKYEVNYENSLEDSYIELKAKRSPFSTIFILLIKFLFCICIVLLAFFEKIFTFIASIATFVGVLLFLIAMIGGAFTIFDKGFQLSQLWGPLLIAFLGFIIPFVGMSLPIALRVIKTMMIEYVLL